MPAISPPTANNVEVLFYLTAFGSLFLAAIIWFGIFGKRRAGEAGFYLAGRALGPVAATATLGATAIGGTSTVLVVGLVYNYGLAAIWMELAGAAGLLLLGLLLAGRVRRLGLFSLPQIAGHFYGEAIRSIAAALVLASQIGWLALLLRACVTLLQPIFDLAPMPLLLITGGAFIFYTSIGGQLAVARTDLLQLALMATGILLVAAPLLAASANWEALPAGRLDFPTAPGYGPGVIAALALAYGLPHLVGSDIYSKLLSCRGQSTARQAALGASALKIIFAAGAATIGLAAAATLPAGLRADSVFPEVITATLPSALAAVVLLALLAALMSSADSVLLTAATVLGRDLLKLPGASVGRVATLIIGLAGIAVAGLFSTLLDLFVFAYSLFSAALTIPILFGFWRARLGLTSSGAAAAMLGGAATVVLCTLAGLPGQNGSLGGLAVSCLLLFGVSALARRQS